MEAREDRRSGGENAVMLERLGLADATLKESVVLESRDGVLEYAAPEYHGLPPGDPWSARVETDTSDPDWTVDGFTMPPPALAVTVRAQIHPDVEGASVLGRYEAHAMRTGIRVTLTPQRWVWSFVPVPWPGIKTVLGIVHAGEHWLALPGNGGAEYWDRARDAACCLGWKSPGGWLKCGLANFSAPEGLEIRRGTVLGWLVCAPPDAMGYISMLLRSRIEALVRTGRWAEVAA